MGVLLLGVNTLYRLFCFFKLFLMVGKGLINELLGVCVSGPGRSSSRIHYQLAIAIDASLIFVSLFLVKNGSQFY